MNGVPCRKAFTDTLLAYAREDKRILVVTTDARGSVTLTDFAEQLPEQFMNVVLLNKTPWACRPVWLQPVRKCLYADRLVFMYPEHWNRLR
jgi:transketolase